MTEMVRIKNIDKIGFVECYEGDGEYIIRLEDETEGYFKESELEFLNFEPYPNLNYKVIRNLILIINSANKFECMDIDNGNFIDFICEKTGLSEELYIKIMELEDE